MSGTDEHHIKEINRVQLQRDKLAEEVIALRRELEVTRSRLKKAVDFLAQIETARDRLEDDDGALLDQLADDVERWMLLHI